MKKVMILGDSLSLPRPGNFKTFNPKEDLELGVEFNQTYPYLLQENLTNFYVINRAVRASTIKSIYERDRMDHIFLTKPDVIVIHVGIVDLWPRTELNGLGYLSECEFAYYYIKILKLLKVLPNTKVICIGIANTSRKMEKRFPGLLNKINIYNKIIKNICNLNDQAIYVDISTFLRTECLEEYIMKDHQHLNAEGNKLIASLIIENISKIKSFTENVTHENLMIEMNSDDMLIDILYFFELDKFMPEEKVVIYGAGELGKKIGEYLLSEEIHISAFIDQSRKRELIGVPIFSVQNITQEVIDADKIIVASKFYKDEMLEELSLLNIDEGKIMTYSEKKKLRLIDFYRMVEA
ncbi:SGNH/GDSL hydrolase family protein [Domibacillus enclensis]|nr:SGNH/GDSL hydrolase family protein [Domibacillus enclensis]SIQ38247.1 Lysophospholipase L1 [Domibacillus enclensis]